jgi:hypothetical protein
MFFSRHFTFLKKLSRVNLSRDRPYLIVRKETYRNFCELNSDRPYLEVLEVSAPELGGESGGQAVLQALEALSEPERVGESEPGLQVQVEALLQPGRQGGRV